MSRISLASREAAQISASLGTATRPELAGAALGSAWAVTGNPAKVSPGLPWRAARGGAGAGGGQRDWGGQRHLCQTIGSTWAQGQAKLLNSFLPSCKDPFPSPKPSAASWALCSLQTCWAQGQVAASSQPLCRSCDPAKALVLRASGCPPPLPPCLFPEPEHELFLVYGKGRPGIIRGMDMGAKVPDEHMIPIENLMNPRALDFHAETGFIYFADTTSYLIGRQKIDGTERETILKDGA